jgi:hypothetical protein
MPTLYEYFGIVIKFFSNEHWPIHVHAFYGDKYACKVEFDVKRNTNEFRKVRGYKMLPHAQMHDLKKLINVYQYDIIQSWINFVVLNQRIRKQRITKRIT